MHKEVQVQILIGRARPAKVLAHGLRDQLVPSVAVIPEQARRAEHRVAHLVAVKVAKREARALAGKLIVRLHGVLEATGLAHDGQGAVAHGDDLRQAAGLKLRRHQEHIGGCVHALRQRWIKLDARGHGAGVLVLEVAQAVLVVAVAGAQHGNLHAAGQNAVECVHDQIQSLLARQARDHHHKRTVVTNLEPQLLLQLGLAHGLARTVVNRVVGGNALVGRRVKACHINAIKDALQRIRTLAQHAVQALTKLGRLDLVGIGGTYRGDGVGIAQRAQHVVDAAGIATQLRGGSGNMCHTQDVLHYGVAKLALERHVVDREHGLDAVVQRQALVELAQEHGRQRRLPVVAVQDVALKAGRQVLQALGDGLGEERKALAIVKESVRIVARKVALVVDEHIGDAVVLELLQPAVLVTPAQAHVKVGKVLHLRLVLVLDGGVLGHHHDDLGAGAHERRRQRARHVTQATGLNKRCALGRGKHDLHLFAGFCHIVSHVAIRE